MATTPASTAITPIVEFLVRSTFDATSAVFATLNADANSTGNSTLQLPAIFTTAGAEQATAGRAAWLIPVIFGLITVCGVVGNSLVIYVIVRHGHMKTVTNYYIVNLAVTDISFLLCCAPFTATLFVAPNWLFGSFMCKFVFYMMQVTGQCTCLTLTAMSIDRYQAIVHPIRSLKSRTTKMACIVNACIWIGSFLISIPVPVYFDLGVTPTGLLVCSELWPLAIMFPGYAVFSFILLYVIPIVTITVCYSIMLRKLWSRVSPGEPDNNSNLHNARQKRKVTRLVLVVVLVFAICWLPIYVIHLWMRLDPYFPWTDATYIFKMAAHTLSYANSSVNPFVYAFMGENYRRYFKKAFPVCFAQKKRRQQAGDAASRTDHTGNFTGTTSGVGGRTVETVALD